MCHPSAHAYMPTLGRHTDFSLGGIFWPRHGISKPSGALEAPHCGANDGHPNRTRPGWGLQIHKHRNRDGFAARRSDTYTPYHAYRRRHTNVCLGTGFRSRVARWKPRIAEPTMATLIEQAWVGVCKFTNPETGTDSPHAAHIYPLRTPHAGAVSDRSRMPGAWFLYSAPVAMRSVVVCLARRPPP